MLKKQANYHISTQVPINYLVLLHTVSSLCYSPQLCGHVDEIYTLVITFTSIFRMYSTVDFRICQTEMTWSKEGELGDCSMLVVALMVVVYPPKGHGKNYTLSNT